MKYNEIREEGEKNEEIIQAVLHQGLVKFLPTFNKHNPPQFKLERNKYIGNGNYQGEYNELNSHYDILLEIYLDNYCSHLANNVDNWFSGTITRWIECKLDKRGVETGNIPVEMYTDPKGKGYTPTGLMNSKSDLWIIRRPTNEYFVFLTSQLRMYAYGNFAKSKPVMMNETSKVPSLITVIGDKYAKKIAIDYGEDIINIDVEKIFFGTNRNNDLKSEIIN